MPLLEIDALDVFYGDAQAVFGVNASLDEADCVAFIGANGAGKTTIMRAIMGLAPVRRGRIAFAGAEIANTRAHLVARRGVAMVPEGRRLFPSLTVLENLRIGGLGRRAGFWTLDKVLTLFPAIESFRDRRPSQISGGQQQMVSIGRALLANPRLLLCDELSLGLAPKVIGEIYESFDRIRASGVAIALVEQDVARAKAASSRAYCLLKGRVSLEGVSCELTETQIAHAYFGS